MEGGGARAGRETRSGRTRLSRNAESDLDDSDDGEIMNTTKRKGRILSDDSEFDGEGGADAEMEDNDDDEEEEEEESENDNEGDGNEEEDKLEDEDDAPSRATRSRHVAQELHGKRLSESESNRGQSATGKIKSKYFQNGEEGAAWAVQAAQTVRALLKNKECDTYFSEPVDAKKLGIPDYFKVIKHPMDLGTILGNIKSDAYKSFSDFKDDVVLTFDNAMRYNPPGNYVHGLAAKFKKRFLELCEQDAVLCPLLQPERGESPVRVSDAADGFLAMKMARWPTETPTAQPTVAVSAGVMRSERWQTLMQAVAEQGGEMLLTNLVP
eukprot:765911-Hanusia_phi.AAC.4